MATTSELQIISARIRERMGALGLNPADVASGCRVSEVTVRNWMKSARYMKACYLRPLARTLKCTVDYLVGTESRAAR